MAGLALIDRLHVHASKRPREPAYLDGQRSLSWKELADRSEAFAAALKSSLPSAGPILLCSVNRLEYPIAFLGILGAGYDVFSVTSDLSEVELQRAVVESKAIAIIGHDHACQSHSQRMPAWTIDGLTRWPNESNRRFHPSSIIVHPWSPSLLLQSSGTTGLPKIVRRSGKSLDVVAAAMVEAIGFTPADHVLAAVPLTHSYGVEHGLLAPVWAGSTVHLCRGLDLPAITAELATDQITIFPSVPSIFELLADVADAPSVRSLRVAYSAGAPLPASVRDRFADRFSVQVTQLYGATEIGSVTYNSPAGLPVDPACVGQPMRGVSVRILDATTTAPLLADEEGQVAVRADSMFDGYLSEPARLIDGYFPTGDLGHLDERGRLYITGRLKLLIDVGGMKVNPLEVEAVLRLHPQVGDCVIVPMIQSETVRRLRAVIEPRDPASPPSPESLRAFVKQHLSGYKVPRIFEMCLALPRSSAGKVLRQQVQNGDPTAPTS